MIEELKGCPVCQSEAVLKKTDHLQDLSISKESFTLDTCEQCSAKFLNPRPDINESAKYYQSSNYISHANKANSPLNAIYKIARNFTLSLKYKWIKYNSNPKSLLDFGCGTGQFLEYVATKGIEVTGFDQSKEALQNIPKRNNITLINQKKDLGKKEYDVITLWHVLEHLHDLRDDLKLLAEILKKDGFLYIAVPNYNSFDAQYYKEYWAAYDLPRHLYHFNPKAISQAIQELPLKPIEQIGMPLDAYYISMISEKFKGSSIPYIKGFIKGYNSNKKAKKTGQYSSIVYVFKKT